ncbi:MAG: CPBP family intramembrane metalloprotease [Saprospiraceae bacterium]|nr:CPBP family intramembrane metalloprotease [Saprospiraceae bacterium]
MNVTWFDHLFFFIIGIVFPAMAFLSERPKEEDEENYRNGLPPKKHIYYSNSLMLFIGALMVLTLWNVTYRSFDTLGFILPVMDTMVIVLCGIIIAIYAADTLFSYFQAKKSPDNITEMGHIMPTSWDDYRHFVILALAAGTCEEVIFRGFMVNYVRELFSGSIYATAIALILPSAIFAVSHLYQGWFAVLKITAISLLFGGIYILSGSLLLVVVIHVFVDLVSGAMLVMMSQRNKH